MATDMATKSPPSFSPTRLIALRERLQLSQEQLAEVIGVTRGAVGHWEQGIRPITGPVARVLCDIESNPEKFFETA